MFCRRDNLHSNTILSVNDEIEYKQKKLNDTAIYLRFSLPLFISIFYLPRDHVRLEPLLGQVGIVLVQDLHQISDVAGRQTESLDLRQLRVGGHVRYAAPQRGKRGVDAVGSTPLLPIRVYPLFDSPYPRNHAVDVPDSRPIYPPGLL